MMVRMFHVRRLVYIFIAICSLYVGLQIAKTYFGFGYVEINRELRLKEIASILDDSGYDTWKKLSAGGQVCRHPELDVNNPDIMKFIMKSKPLQCSKIKDWVSINGSTARITDEAKQHYGDIECSFTDVFRGTDFSTYDGVTTQTHTEYNLEETDFVRINCKSNTGMTWSNIMAGIRHDQDVLDRSGWHKVPLESLHLNVLMFGFDSLSRNMFVRKLPKSYDYIVKKLNGIVLQGYNIVGDGTPQALIPILTGLTELELPDTRKRMGNKATFVNVYPFVWKEFQAKGYVTAFLEDCPNIGTFTYRLKGFDTPPTDHYMRTYYWLAAAEFHRNERYCMGSLPRHKVMMDYIRNFFQVYREKPKFLFGFHGELSHDSYNDIGAADEDLLDMVKKLNQEGYLNNTVMIIMSDHGHRFTDIRNSQQGKQEERLPMFSFVFPPWFSQQYPEAFRNFQRNIQRLTTPFDIHPTLQNILKFEGAGRGNIRERAISLFKEVPDERTCADAYIEPHWCTCLEWQEVSLQDSVVLKAAQAFVDRLNQYMSKETDMCAELQVNQVQWAAKLVPNDGILKFLKNADKDGFLPNLSADTKLSKEVYQLKVKTQPGGGLFEASLQYDLELKNFSYKIADVSRINKYGDDDICVKNSHHHLSKFCFCKRRQLEH